MLDDFAALAMCDMYYMLYIVTYMQTRRLLASIFCSMAELRMHKQCSRIPWNVIGFCAFCIIF